MPHADLGLGGPLWTVAQFMFLAAVGFAIFVLLDSVRRVHRSGERYVDRMLKYGAFQMLFLLVLLLAQFEILNPWLPIAAVMMIPFSVGQGVVYLLKVVYPKPPEDPSRA